jgi:hypothetical protein
MTEIFILPNGRDWADDEMLYAFLKTSGAQAREVSKQSIHNFDRVIPRSLIRYSVIILLYIVAQSTDESRLAFSFIS